VGGEMKRVLGGAKRLRPSAKRRSAPCSGWPSTWAFRKRHHDPCGGFGPGPTADALSNGDQIGEREKKLTSEDQKEALGFSESGWLYLTVRMEESLRMGRSPEDSVMVMERLPLA